MVTKTQFEKIKENEQYDIKTISALTHAQIEKLCEREDVQLSMFDEKNIVEVVDAEAGIRYGLFKNNTRALKEGKTRQELLDRTRIELDKIINFKRKNEDGDLGIRVGKIINKYKVSKFVQTQILEGRFSLTFDEEKIKEEEQFDGCYVIFTNVKEENMDIHEVVKNYRKLIKVEQAFRNLKTARLEIQPIYHRLDERIRCQVFLCMFSYYLRWKRQEQRIHLRPPDRTVEEHPTGKN